jgi:magnesium transporter
MAETSSSRRSRSETPRRRRPRQSEADGAKRSTRKGGGGAGGAAGSGGEDGTSASTKAAGSTSGNAPSPPKELSAKRGGVRIVACHGGTTTESANVKEIARLLAQEGARLWIDLCEPGPDDVGIVAEALGLHPLIAEDIAERDQRSKVETFDQGVVHIVLFALHYAGEASASEIDFVLGNKYLLTVHDGALGREDTAPLRLGVDHALKKGPDYLLYALADAVVDGYFPVLDKIGDDIDELQDRVMETASDWTLQRLFSLKRELATLRRATSPAREIFAQLTNREVDTIDPKHIVYYRDVYDHLIRVTDELDNDRDLVAGTLDIYVSIVNNDLSRIMKRLTGVTVILAGIGAVAGIFGMSEAGSALSGAEGGGFWLVTALVVLLGVSAAVVLRRFDWI